MTESEAKMKWCPFARVPVEYRNTNSSQHIAPNRAREGEPIGPCIASACMAWREERRGLGTMGGFCGLAGRPA